jgi:hypothetical protein
MEKFGSGIRDKHPGSAKTIFWVKMFKFFYANPGSGMRKNSDPGSGINIKDPQHWIKLSLLFEYREIFSLSTHSSLGFN